MKKQKEDVERKYLSRIETGIHEEISAHSISQSYSTPEFTRLRQRSAS